MKLQTIQIRASLGGILCVAGLAVAAQEPLGPPIPQEAPKQEPEQGEPGPQPTVRIDPSKQGPGQEEEPEAPDLLANDPFAGDAGMQEMQELFAEIELTLARIDTMLLDASGGEVSKLEDMEESGLLRLLDEAPEAPSDSSSGESGTGQPGDSPGNAGGGSNGGAPAPGLAGVLQRSEQEAVQVLGGIERVLELAAQQQSQSSSSMPSDGNDPMQGQQNNRTNKTDSPEGPQEQGQQPQPQPQKPEQGDQPEGGEESDDPGGEDPAERMPDQATGGGSKVDPAADSWGELPVHYRDVFRAEGGKGLPAEYRDWIDAYYRRLNQRSGG